MQFYPLNAHAVLCGRCAFVAVQAEEGRTAVQQLQEVAASKDAQLQQLTAKATAAEQAAQGLQDQVCSAESYMQNLQMGWLLCVHICKFFNPGLQPVAAGSQRLLNLVAESGCVLSMPAPSSNSMYTMCKCYELVVVCFVTFCLVRCMPATCV